MSTLPITRIAPPWALPAMLGGSAILAFGPWLVRIAETPPIASAFWRLALAAPILFLLALRAPAGHTSSIRLARPIWGLALLAAAFFAADLAAWHRGIMRTSLGNATLLANAATFLLPLWAFAIHGQRLGRTGTAALVTAALGTALLLGHSVELSPDHLLGDLLCLLAAVFYTGYLICVDRLRGHLAALPMLAWVSMLGAALLLPAALAMESTLAIGQWPPILALALGSQVLGQGLIVWAIPHLRPLVIGLALLVQPIISASLGAWAYAEIPGPSEFAGALLIATALLLARLRQPG